jgi:hypothetical protein
VPKSDKTLAEGYGNRLKVDIEVAEGPEVGR